MRRRRQGSAAGAALLAFRPATRTVVAQRDPRALGPPPERVSEDRHPDSYPGEP